MLAHNEFDFHLKMRALFRIAVATTPPANQQLTEQDRAVSLA